MDREHTLPSKHAGHRALTALRTRDLGRFYAHIWTTQVTTVGGLFVELCVSKTSSVLIAWQNHVTSARMVALISFLLNVVASLFKSKIRLEAENAALRHQLIVLQRKVRGRVPFTNSDRLFFVQLYRWFPSVLKALTIIRPETLVRAGIVPPFAAIGAENRAPRHSCMIDAQRTRRCGERAVAGQRHEIPDVFPIETICAFTVGDAPAASRPLLQDLIRSSPTGRFLNLHAQMAHSPAVLAAYTSLRAVIREAAANSGNVTEATWKAVSVAGVEDVSS
jgi:hypothetical protein